MSSRLNVQKSIRRNATIALVGLGLTGVGIIGCGGGGEVEGERCLVPHLSPVPFGEMYPKGNRDEDLLSPERSPYEWVLQLQSNCGAEVNIEKVCLVGDTDHFILEGPEPTTATGAQSAVVRITYERQDPHSGSDSDQIALVVQSNADDHPTLIVPVCARIIEDGNEKSALECESPVTVAAGQKDASLCS